MTAFYKQVILDKELSYFFTHELGEDITNEDWIEHIDTLADFWLAELVGEGPYEGNFVGMHIKVPHIKRESFTQWMKLFFVCTDELYTSDISESFKKKSMDLSEKFMSILNI